MEKQSQELQAALNKIEALTTEVKTLNEFVSLNVGTNTPPPLDTDADNVTVPPQGDFQVVRNNVRPKKRILPITKCHNSFQILSDTANDDEEIRLISDS